MIWWKYNHKNKTNLLRLVWALDKVNNKIMVRYCNSMFLRETLVLIFYFFVEKQWSPVSYNIKFGFLQNHIFFSATCIFVFKGNKSS